MPRRSPNPTPPCAMALAYNLRDAARISGLSVATLRRRAKAGELILFRNGGRALVNGDSLRRLLTPATNTE